MLTIAPGVAEFIAGRNPCLAKLWTITRTDSTVLYFTNHDREIIYDGNTYTPAGGFDGSADRLDGGLREHNKTAKGLITSDRITIEDCMGGVYEDAVVTESSIDWRYPWAGVIYTRKWWVDRVKFDGEIFEAEMAGPSRNLRNQVGDIWARTCRHRLGEFDATTLIGCTVDTSLYTTTSVDILGTLDTNKRMVFVVDPATLSSPADGYFDDGEVIFTSGANSGRTAPIKSWTSADSKIVLQVEMPFEIAAGDVCSLVAGCNRTFVDCRDKFNNVVEFGGSRFQPFTDRMLTTPQQ